MSATPFTNITISGGVAVGTSTLRNNLEGYLLPLGWEIFSGGEFMREHAIKRGSIRADDSIHHAATDYEDEFDREFDANITRRLKTENKLIVESWLSGYLARNISHCLKVLLVCSNEDIRIDRFINRDKVPMHDAEAIMKRRENDNFAKWRRLYGNYDFFDKKYYTIVIDTAKSGQMETTGIVLDMLGYKK